MKIHVTKMVSNFMKTNPQIKIPILNSESTMLERIRDICQHFQQDAINKKIGKKPEFNKNQIKLSVNKINRWQELLTKSIDDGIGREFLFKHLPDFKDYDIIINNVKDLYIKSPIDAGNYAHKYIGYNRFFDYELRNSLKTEEETKWFSFEFSDEQIGFREDLICIDGIYEFKLTNSKYLQNKLKEAIVQLYIYDFLYKIYYGLNFYKPLLAEICLIDKEELLLYGTIFSYKVDENKLIEIDRQVLKDIFKVNKFSKLEKIYDLIDFVYDTTSYRDEEDVNLEVKFFKNTNS